MPSVPLVFNFYLCTSVLSILSCYLLCNLLKYGNMKLIIIKYLSFLNTTNLKTWSLEAQPKQPVTMHLFQPSPFCSLLALNTVFLLGTCNPFGE